MFTPRYSFDGALYCHTHAPKAADTRCTDPTRHADENGACTENCHGYGPNPVSTHELQDDDVCDTCNAGRIAQEALERTAGHMLRSYDMLRHVIFTPNRNSGPRFHLWTLDCGPSATGKHRIGYVFKAYRWTSMGGKRNRSVSETVFADCDFYCAPQHPIDSDACIRSLMNFLTLRPGDTDADYFANYSEAQRDFADMDAEAVSMEVLNRFGE